MGVGFRYKDHHHYDMELEDRKIPQDLNPRIQHPESFVLHLTPSGSGKTKSFLNLQSLQPAAQTLQPSSLKP